MRESNRERAPEEKDSRLVKDKGKEGRKLSLRELFPYKKGM